MKQIHETEINVEQNRWRHQQMREMFGPNINVNDTALNRRFWNEVNLTKIQEFVELQETAYKDLWIESGAKKKRINEIKLVVDGGQNQARLKLGRGARMAQVLPHLATGLGIFSAIGANFKLAYSIRSHSEPQQAAWQVLEERYDLQLDVALRGGRITWSGGHNLRIGVINYVKLLGTNEEVVSGIDSLVGAYIDKFLFD